MLGTLGLKNLFWFGLFFFISVIIILEKSDCSLWCSCRRQRSYRSGRIISWLIVNFGTFSFCGIFRLLFRSIRITWVTRDISKFSFVSIGINITILSSYNAISSSSLFLEATVCSFVTGKSVSLSLFLHTFGKWCNNLSFYPITLCKDVIIQQVIVANKILTLNIAYSTNE